MFLVVSNENILCWEENKSETVDELGKGFSRTVDFPEVSPFLSSSDVRRLAEELADKICDNSFICGKDNSDREDFVLINGDVSLMIALVPRLKKLGSFTCLVDVLDDEGNWVQFREV